MLDATKRMRRRLAGRLHDDETLLAAVSVHRTGTTAAGLRGATAAIGGGPAAGVAFRADEDADAARAGDGRGSGPAGASPYQYLVLTSRRVMVVRRSVFGRARDVVFEVPVERVTALQLRPGVGEVELRLADGRTLAFETPKAPRFLPEVYRRLPGLLAGARGPAPR
jgi:hypothetical protein